jgi:hypothetical protein
MSKRLKVEYNKNKCIGQGNNMKIREVIAEYGDIKNL